MSNAIQSVPLPAARAFGGNQGVSKYDFGSLRAGTSDALLFDSAVPKKTMSKLHSAIGAYRKRGGEGKFTVRPVEVEENGAKVQKVGVWRLS